MTKNAVQEFHLRNDPVLANVELDFRQIKASRSPDFHKMRQVSKTDQTFQPQINPSLYSPDFQPLV